jgi:hypothetical protein
MKIAADALLTLRDRERYGTYRLLIVTDGEATDAERVEAYLPDILSRGITVDVIGVDMQDDHSLATKVHSYRRADDPASLTRALQETFAESSGAPDDAGTSDFEQLAPIPNEVAVAALAALTVSGNHPIGEEPPAAGPGPRETTPITEAPMRPRTTPRVAVGAVTVLLLGLLCFAVFVVLVVVVGVVVLVFRRSS